MNHVKKPDWLKISIGANARYAETKHIVDSHKLHTICSSGRCPNMGECWGKGTATFMIGGNICTRSCKFCNTQLFHLTFHTIFALRYNLCIIITKA